jgi:hypothetical protein
VKQNAVVAHPSYLVLALLTAIGIAAGLLASRTSGRSAFSLTHARRDRDKQLSKQREKQAWNLG